MPERFDLDKHQEDISCDVYSALNSCITLQGTVAEGQLDRVMESIGAWDTYQCERENFGKGDKWKELLASVVSHYADTAIQRLQKTVRKARGFVESCISKQRDANGSLPDETSESALIAIKDRMRIELMAHGWDVALRESAALNKQKRGSFDDDDSSPWRAAYDQCLNDICSYDMILRRGQAILATAPACELRSMRSLLFGKRALPWWLDGRVELMTLARACPGAWRVCDASLRECGLSDRLIAEVMRYVGGSGNGVESGIERWCRGDLCDSYSWEIQNDDREVHRVELLAPRNASGKRIRLQLKTRDGTRPAESSWLMGRMMMLNGLMFHWTKIHRDSVVSAELPNKGNQLPRKGRFVLVDLFTLRVLEPTGRGASISE